MDKTDDITSISLIHIRFLFILLQNIKDLEGSSCQVLASRLPTTKEELIFIKRHARIDLLAAFQ